MEELTNLLNQSTREKHTATISRDRDATFKLAESDRQKARLEEEVRSYEEKLGSMRKLVNDMVCYTPRLYGPSMLTALIANDRRRTSAGKEAD